ncbi:MAG TPA: SRPBCC domain-containing protein, partial [Pedobacter sp.]
MKSILDFDFTVNKEKNTVNVKREFNADLELAWEAWTNPEILDQWWAPKPYKNKTKSMDFREGGMWLYSMTSPKDETHWCKAEYGKIEHQKSYSYTDNFCDENANVGEKFPNSI